MEELVHIIPVGYEYDRIVAPFKHGYRANRVYLLSSIKDVEGPMEVLDKHRHYVDKVTETLEKYRIEVKIVPTNLIDNLALIQQISRIVYKEKTSGNIVYINMSGAGRPTSVAATIVGMVHDIRVYYVKADEYTDQDPRMQTHGYSIIEDEPEITMLENFKINMPNTIQLTTLVKIYKTQNTRTIDLIEHLGNQGFNDYNVDYYKLTRNQKTALIMKLNRNIIDKLTKNGYITKTKQGRENNYNITDTGKYIASISGKV